MTNVYEDDYREGVMRLVKADQMVRSGECSRKEALEKTGLDTLRECRVRTMPGGRILILNVIRFIFQGIDVGRTESIANEMEETK